MNPKTFHKLSYGLYLVSSKNGEKLNGQIANAVFQVTSDPPKIAVCINKQNFTHECIQQSKFFAVSILSKETPMEFIGNFGFKSGRNFDKFRGVKYKIGITGAPVVLENAVGYVEAEVVETLDVGTHTIFVGNVLSAELIGQGEPMTYAYYHEIKGGRSPKAAPTYIKEKEKLSERAMDRYVCTICGYVYDPEKGDPESGIKPGTPFEELPDDWTCPVCGADKSAFKKES